MSTPLKSAAKECCLCCSADVKHITGIEKKVRSGEDILDKFSHCIGKSVSTQDASFLYICRSCGVKLDKFFEFRTTAIQTYENAICSLQRTKRLHKTPQSVVKQQSKRPSLSTAEWLLKSVEKLKCEQTADAHLKCRKRLVLINDTEGISQPVQVDTVVEPIIRKGFEWLPSEDHAYVTAPVILIPERIEEANLSVQGSGISSAGDADVLTKTELKKIAEYITCTYKSPIKVSKLAFLITKCTSLLSGIKQLILKDIESMIQRQFKPQQSMLFSKQTKQLMNEDMFAAIVLEIKQHTPFLLDILSVCCHGPDLPARVTMISTIFGMMMHSRNKQATSVQRLFSALCIRYHADNKLLTRLNAIHLKLAEKTKVTLVSSFGDFATQAIVNKIRSGVDGKINGDNLDFRVTTGDMRLNSRNQDFHFFASDWTPGRVNASSLANDRPIGDVSKISVENLLAKTEEIAKFKADLKILIGRDLVDTFACFKWMKLVLPNNIPHDLSATMSTKSNPCIMPIMLKNEQSYSDCIHILESYQQQAKLWYQEAGREFFINKTFELPIHKLHVRMMYFIKEDDFANLNMPIGGDQLTRVRLQSAKLLRAGSHTSEDRFDNLTPMVIELFHTMQDYIAKLCKKFLNVANGREKCTLANLRIIIQRTNVNSQVKVRFKAHEDFILTASKAYVTGLVLEHFGMTGNDSSPCTNKAPINVETCEAPRRQKAFDNIMDPFINKFLSLFHLQNTEIEQDSFGQKLLLTIEGKETQVEGHVNMNVGTTSVLLAVGTQQYLLQISIDNIKKRKEVMVSIPGLQDPVKIRANPEEPDDTRNYVLNFLQWYFVMRNFRDAIKEGDIVRTNISLKLMIPFFYLHSKLSKYLIECIDFILKTEVMLTPQMSLRVRAGSFINRKGKPGKNKPADMEKENQVKFLKDLIRGLGKAKTEKTVVMVSKAGPVILDVVTNFDKMAGIIQRSTTHKPKSSNEDLETLYHHLRRERPLRETPGRKLESFNGITSDPFAKLNRNEFCSHIMKTVDRLARSQVGEGEEDPEQISKCL